MPKNEQRKDDRDSLLLLAGMRLSDQGETLRIKLRNLSKGGMMAECPVHVECGDALTVDLRHIGWVGGTVTWANANRFGIAFNRQIDCKAVRPPMAISDDVPEMCVRRPRVAANSLPRRPDMSGLRRIS